MKHMLVNIPLFHRVSNICTFQYWLVFVLTRNKDRDNITILYILPVAYTRIV